MENRNGLGTINGRRVPLEEQRLRSQMAGVDTDLQLQKLPWLSPQRGVISSGETRLSNGTRGKTCVFHPRFKACCVLSGLSRKSQTNLHKVDEQHTEQTIQCSEESKPSSQSAHIYPILFLRYRSL